jgi:hypothetical protein
MHGINAGGRSVALLGLIAAVTLGTMLTAEAATINVSWTAPTTNVDGTPLRDLAGYHLYLDTQAPSCPSADFVSIPSSTAAPAAGQQMSEDLTGLDANTTYFAQVTAVDQSGNESPCSGVASGVAHADFTVAPTTTVSFGSVATGATVDRTFTVQNTSTATLSGSVSVGAPFLIAAGGSFSLAPNASQSVTVRFAPTAAGSFLGNVNVSAGSDTVSRGVSGSASGGATTSPSSTPPPTGPLKVFITAPAAGATVSGTAWVVLWVEGTSGSANAFTLSANGAVVGSQTTSSRGPVTIPWTPSVNGSNTLTASVRDATGQTGAISLPVNVVGASGSAPAPPPPPPPANDTLNVFITQPGDGDIVSGTPWIVIWADGTTGSSNTFTLSVDGGVVGSETTWARGPVAIPWETSIANGFHTLTATVRDAAGHTGRATFRLYVWN